MEEVILGSVLVLTGIALVDIVRATNKFDIVERELNRIK